MLTLCKAFLTYITDVGALPRVLPHVNLQGLVLCELAVAHGAREPLQAHVAQQVTLQVALNLFLSQNYKFFKNFQETQYVTRPGGKNRVFSRGLNF